MDSSRVKVTNQFARTQIQKSGAINFSQYVLSESSPLSGGHHEGSIASDENVRDWKQGDDTSGQGNLGVAVNQKIRL